MENINRMDVIKFLRRNTDHGRFAQELADWLGYDPELCVWERQLCVAGSRYGEELDYCWTHERFAGDNHPEKS